MYGFIRKLLSVGMLGILYSSPLLADIVQLNSGGGSSVTNGLRIYIEDTTQIQVRRLNNTGQLYSPTAVPSNTLLDNGIYLRANGGIYGPDHFGFPSNLTPTTYSNRTVSTVVPATPSQGVVQSTTSAFRVGSSGPQVSVVWKYIYPLDYVTAEVTLVIPSGYAVSANNPVRYYHAVDTYLGGSDNGCGVRYIDTNGKQVVGTYPLSSGSCPSSSSLPANLDVIESFRERTGTFNHYCVGLWSSFWSNSTGNACAIAKSTSLSDSISTTYIDTGAAIEYDFTAPGTYIFSYDFVVGSTFVPNYDHIEIRHPGTATLCPVDMQVLACTSSTVPCPDDSMISTGSLTGNLALSPGTSTVTVSPGGFEVGGSAGPIATATLQASTGATYTLGATSLSKAPLNGVKCWNTATNSQNCSFTFSNTPCLTTFECLESGVGYTNLSTNAGARNPIYTKLAGKGFSLDVYALLTAGIKATGYVGNNVTVELVNDNGGCGATTVASKTVSFISTDAGKKTVSFSDSDIPKAYPRLRCKVTDTSLNKNGCSTDNFSVRPTAFTVTSNSAQTTLNAFQTAPAATPSATVTPVFRTRTDNFNLTVSTGESGYNGTPMINNNQLQAHPNAPAVGTVSGTFATATSGVSAGDSFQYSEVGHFKFKPQGIYDDTFTFVDSTNGDCDNTNAFNTDGGGATPKKYGCKIGNLSESNYFGRFIPVAFRVVPDTVTKGCDTFVYYGQDSVSTSKPGLTAKFKLQARNTTDDNDNSLTAVTKNYTDVADPALDYARFDLASWPDFHFAVTPALAGGAVFSASAVTPAVSGTWSNGEAAVVAGYRISRPAAQIGNQTISITAQPQETDSGKTITSNAKNVASDVQYRYGRLAIVPAHGSELLPLPVQMEAQYWDGTLNAYKRNVDDSCTVVPLQTIVMKNYKGNLNACETVLSGNPAVHAGKLGVLLSAPKIGSDGKPNTGSVDLEVNLGTAVGGEKTCLSSSQSDAASGDLSWLGGTDPLGRASFGIYKAPVIYMRENF
ncbi:DUF6701 domain-containing protein [Methylophilus rhizosphaerae]|uniref:DUF6701 domain-containing protein n=1 Tax=Methylophilus rhizosphaerae TaxID=492660 RepID=UPI000A5093E2|nr:DUF6701 domain-containing protein [Methylophilus rhizosphaerae]